MIVPVRCFTCGKVIGSAFEEYTKRTKEGENAQKVLDELKVSRYCCRRMILSHVDLIEDVMYFD